MTGIQSRLVGPPVGDEEAWKKALDIIRSFYGNIPYPGKPVLEAGIWKIPIIARYPRVLVNEIENLPEKVRFMVFEDLGEIKIIANTGEIEEKPSFWQLQSSIKDKLDLIQNTVFKALVKVGASKFSTLPLSEHMHTPIEDILSRLLVNNTIDLDLDLGALTHEYRAKYLQHISYLKFVGLVRVTGSIVEPDNALIEIEKRSRTITQALSESLAYFFANGYENLETIKQVIGPHLIVTGSIYQRSIECGEATFLRTRSIEDAVRNFYSGQPFKVFKVPRYLVQCVSVGLIETKSIAGEEFWGGTEEIFHQIMAEEEILWPIREYIDQM
jgi:hypothetical protein